ncbi:MAG: sodium:solute symporter [Bacteroidota bacterium]|jgi:Na+/proline symporter|nr:sodium:solute symporter [Chitinophagaceae bacterium]
MSPFLLFSFVIGYFLVLLGVAAYTSRNATNETFFIGNRNSNWVLVAFGMIGTSLSGVTFVSVPGTVGNMVNGGYGAFGYFQVILGYIIGYMVIAFVLIPLYYKLNLTSIYHYLEIRLSRESYKTGALFFIISRLFGATARLYLVINVLQIFILDQMGIPFVLTTAIILAMILLYTWKGGVKTIVYTDTLQTSFMLLGLVICLVYILSEMNIGMVDAFQRMSDHQYLHIFDTNVLNKSFFLKNIIGGAVIAITMTGMDQEMMQKNISVKRMQDSQKNILTFTGTLVIVNLLFLVLGGLLYLYMIDKGAIYENKSFLFENKNIIGDDLFPSVALFHLPPALGIIFIIALISALFPSADGALTALTSSFCIDILGIHRRKELTEEQQKRTRMSVHLSFAVVFLLCILLFKWIDNKSIIGVILDLAGYTYGPLLGLFAFGILTKRVINKGYGVTIICLAAPACSYLLGKNAASIFNGYQIGFEMLLINGIMTFIGLWIYSKKAS